MGLNPNFIVKTSDIYIYIYILFFFIYFFSVVDENVNKFSKCVFYVFKLDGDVSD